MKKSILYPAGAALAAALAAGAWQLHHKAQQPPPGATAEPVAAVLLATVSRATLPTTVNAYGDVVPGKLQSVSLARPGLVAGLLVVAGQQVRQGTVVAHVAADPVAEAAYRQARSALALATGEAQRTQALFGLQLATASQVDTARKAVADAQANADAQEKLGGGASAVELRAPFDGVVVSLAAAQGDRLVAGAPLMQIGRVDRLRVNLGVEPADRAAIRPGASVDITPLQPPGGNAAKAPAITGQVATVQDMLDARTQLVSAVVDVAPAATGLLVPGMHVTARIRTGEQQGWVVPRSAVLTDNQGAYLFQVRNGKGRRVAVTPLAQQGDRLAVSGDLAAQEAVVAQGNYELADGMAVREAKP